MANHIHITHSLQQIADIGATWYKATNDANPQIRIGSADANEVHLQTVYDTGAQTLNYFEIATDSGSSKGHIVLSPASGYVGIGTNNPLTKLNVVTTATTSPRGILSSQYSTGTDGARVGFAKARGTEASPLTVVTGDTLGRLMFRGHDGSNFLEMASVEAITVGTIGTNRIPTNLIFSTATDASPSVLTERMWLDTIGNLGLNIAPKTSGYGRHIAIGSSGAYYSAWYTQAIDTDDLRFVLVNNAYSTGTDTWAYYSTGPSVTRYQSKAGTHKFSYAAPGTADATITWTDSLYLDRTGNVGINGQLTFGTSAAGVIAIKSGTAPTTTPVSGDVFQAWVADRGGTAGKAALHWRSEDNTVGVIGDYSGFGTAAPTSLVDLQQAGTATALTDVLEITNSGNAAAMTDTRTGILINQYYYDAGTPAVADAARITVGTEGNWTSTESTQDAYMALSVAVNGTVTEMMRIPSTGVIAMPYGVSIVAANIATDTTTGMKIGTATDQKLGFFNKTPVVQLAKASYNNWAALGDVVNALVAIGLFDAA